MAQRTDNPRPRSRRQALRLVALVASLATVLLLVQFPPCGSEGEACAAMIGLDAEPAAEAIHPASGSSCPLAAPDGDGMECCEEATSEQPAPPAAPDAPSKQLRDKLEAPTPQAQCPVDCVPCADEKAPSAENGAEGALPEVPLYTLLSSYLR